MFIGFPFLWEFHILVVLTEAFRSILLGCNPLCCLFRNYLFNSDLGRIFVFYMTGDKFLESVFVYYNFLRLKMSMVFF